MSHAFKKLHLRFCLKRSKVFEEIPFFSAINLLVCLVFGKRASNPVQFDCKQKNVEVFVAWSTLVTSSLEMHLSFHILVRPFQKQHISDKKTNKQKNTTFLFIFRSQKILIKATLVLGCKFCQGRNQRPPPPPKKKVLCSWDRSTPPPPQWGWVRSPTFLQGSAFWCKKQSVLQV